MRLVIARHGETEENKNDICQGQMHGKLTRKGITQAKKLARRLKNERFDAVYCSDLNRAKDTCREIMKFHPETRITYVKELRERCKGVFEGMHHEKVRKKAKDLGLTYRHRPPGGETHGDKDKRVMRFYKKMLKQHMGNTVLWITHGEVILTIIMKILGLKWKQRRAVTLHNSSVTIVKVDKKKDFRLERVNCISHL